jgi:hypothetical protein
MPMGPNVGGPVEDDEHFVQRIVAMGMGAEARTLLGGCDGGLLQVGDALASDLDDGFIANVDSIGDTSALHGKLRSQATFKAGNGITKRPP